MLAIASWPDRRQRLAAVAMLALVAAACCSLLIGRDVRAQLVEHVPEWSVCAVLALLTVTLWLFDELPGVRLPRRRLVRPNPPLLCRHCHYELFGNFSGVCPECGKATGWATPEQVEQMARATMPLSRRGGARALVNPFQRSRPA
jgi:hypothetical protein